MVKTCLNCGEESPDIAKFCIKCGSEFDLSLSGFDKYLGQETISQLESASLSYDEYENVINDIIASAKINYSKLINDSEYDEDDLFPLKKITYIALSFTPILSKIEGNEDSSYGFNLIKVDERLNSSQKILNILKELSHHLLAEILENIMSYVLGVEKDDGLEAVVAASLKFKNAFLMDEYCSCIVQEKFIPSGYQNFEDIYEILDSFTDNQEKENALFELNFGKSIAQDIIRILNEFIDDNLKEKIRIQFNVDRIESINARGDLEDISTITDIQKIKHITFVTLAIPIKIFSENKGAYSDIISQYTDKFKVINGLNKQL